jgi:hypothetical protein
VYVFLLLTWHSKRLDYPDYCNVYYYPIDKLGSPVLGKVPGES